MLCLVCQYVFYVFFLNKTIFKPRCETQTQKLGQLSLSPGLSKVPSFNSLELGQSINVLFYVCSHQGDIRQNTHTHTHTFTLTLTLTHSSSSHQYY